MKILELGCGTGSMWIDHREEMTKCEQIVLSDFSAGMVETAKENIGDMNPVKCEVIDVQNIPYDDSYFDIVIANYMLYRVPDIDKAMNEVSRVLKTGGFFYAATSGENGIMETVTRILNMGRKYSDAIEYIQDNNFIRAQEEAEKALAVAEKLRDRKYIQEISDYLKLIEALNSADSYYADGKYQDAQAGYVTAKERSRYADHVADAYIDQRLEDIVAYLSVYDYIQLGDTLREQGDYDRAEEKYLQAKQLATSVYFEEGRNETMAALEELYSSRQEAEEAMNQQAAETAAETVSAAQLAAEGDKAFAEGDYGSANVYYAMAIEKYQGLGQEEGAAGRGVCECGQ